ncbi:hypothetical protein ABIA61_005097 [Paenibacillus sp. RC21]
MIVLLLALAIEICIWLSIFFTVILNERRMSRIGNQIRKRRNAHTIHKTRQKQ